MILANLLGQLQRKQIAVAMHFGWMLISAQKQTGLKQPASAYCVQQGAWLHSGCDQDSQYCVSTTAASASMYMQLRTRWSVGTRGVLFP